MLHIGITGELRYDSNVFYEATNPTSALALRISPNFALATRSQKRLTGPDGEVTPSRVAFRIGAGVDYKEWLVSSTGNRPPRQFNVNAGTALSILPIGPVATELFDNFVRSSQPSYFATNNNFDRDLNELGIRLRIKPGGGRLELQLGYIFGVDLWETDQFNLKDYDNYYHHTSLRLLYKFLPKTSVYILADDVAYQYLHTDGVFRPNGYPLRVTAGLNGLLTSKLTFDIYGGYANGFYQSGPSPNTGIAGLSLTWRPYSLGTLSLAYRHDFENTLLGVYADIDNVQASWSQQIWRLLAYLRVAYQNTRPGHPGFRGQSPQPKPPHRQCGDAECAGRLLRLQKLDRDQPRLRPQPHPIG